ncbi:RsiV family protein [Brachyspira pulli]|uniref:RsiV family protein n=1 Tax=Brachyspira pulli TaxID=310721 RepID=UPI00300579E0
MLKRFVYIFLLIIIIVSCGKNASSSDNNSDSKNGSSIEESKFYMLSGNISGEKASMYLYVNSNKNSISGYYYTKNKKALITGSINNNKLNMQEVDENNNMHATINGVLSDDIVFSAEIKYDESNEVKDMEFALNRNLPVYYANIIDYYKNDIISNSIFSYHRTSFSFSKNNENETLNIDNSIMYIEEECNNYYNEWKALLYVGSSNITYEIDNTVNVGYIDSRVIALDNYSSMYTGGAHRSTANLQEVFSLEDSNLITIRDLISDFNDNNLISIMREKILMTGSTKEDYFDFNSITMENSTYRILPNSINFIWQPYDIAPYSTGTTEISFSFEELKPFVKEGSPLSYLFI